jgi:hypothetical protein
MRDKFNAVRWLALLVYFAGLVLLFITQNVRMSLLFNIFASGLICFDSFVLTPQPRLSVLGSREDMKPKFRPSRLAWVGFALLLAGLISSFHIRLSALLMMSGLCSLVLDRYIKTSSISESKQR